MVHSLARYPSHTRNTMLQYGNISMQNRIMYYKQLPTKFAYTTQNLSLGINLGDWGWLSEIPGYSWRVCSTANLCCLLFVRVPGLCSVLVQSVCQRGGRLQHPTCSLSSAGRQQVGWAPLWFPYKTIYKDLSKYIFWYGIAEEKLSFKNRPFVRPGLEFIRQGR